MSTRMTAAPPPLAFGTFKLRGDELRQALHTALAVGYRHIDTATCYRNEEVVGEVLQDEIGSGRLTREDVFITSKLAPKEQGYEQARAAVLGSLERLQLEYIDLYLIHWPGVAGLRREDPGNQEPRRHSWRALEELQGEGKVRHIGVSNYTVRHLQELLQRCHVPPFLNQVECHPLCQQRELRDYCHQHNILLEAYSPLGCGQLLDNPVVQDIARQHCTQASCILLAWAHIRADCLAVKSCDPARIKANFQVPPTLTEDELEQLDALDQNHHLCWDPTLVP